MLSVSSIADAVTQWMFSAMKYDTAAYCQLEAVFDEKSLITEEGGLLSIIEIRGIRSMPGEDDTLAIFRTLIDELQTAFKNGDHTIQLVYDIDPGRVREEIETMGKPMRKTAHRLKLRIDDVLDDYFGAVAGYCQSEYCWLVVETHTTTLDKKTFARSKADKLHYMTENNIPFLTMAQNPFRLVPEIITPHETLLSTLTSGLSAVGVSLKTMDVLELCKTIRGVIDNEFTDPEWEVDFPGRNIMMPPPKSRISPWKDRKTPRRNKLPIRHGRAVKNEASHVWNPPLSRQLIPRAPMVPSAQECQDLSHTEPVRIGSKWYAPMAMELGPNDPQTFLHLFYRVPQDMPWRISYEIRPGGLSAKWFSRLVVSIFGWMGENNKKMARAFRALTDIETQDDGVVVSFRFNMVTWADTPKLLAKRQLALARAVQGWGQCDVTDNLGDPVSAFFATVPGIPAENPAMSMAAPLPDVVHMMPLTRPASPWDSGTVLFRTPNGKLYPVGIGSDVQAASVDLIWAPMGAGKSVLLNTINLFSCFLPGLDDFPRMAILDVGPSSSGVASLLQKALPPDRKHLIAYFKLRMSAECAINPCDTQLGCRYPSPDEREFLVNFLSLLMTPEGDTKPYNMAPQLIGVLIDEIYKKYSDPHEPKFYQRYQDGEVDRLVEDLRIPVNDNTTWWNIEDALFSKGQIHGATLAHRYAVPTLHDFAGVVNMSAVLDLFAESDTNAVEAGNGQKLVTAFSTTLSSAIREFPILASHTKFDIGDARVVVMDLNDVARDGGRRTSILYMLARYASTRNFYLDPKIAELAPDIYRTYHLDRTRLCKEQKKALVYDEYHRTKGIQAVRRQVLQDIREGRKWNIRVSVASQDVNDFDEEMIKLAYSIYVMRPANQQEIGEICAKFGLSDVAARRMDVELTAPSAAGANFLAIFNTKRGKFCQILTNTIGPITRWALTTSPEEMGLRNRLYEVLGDVRARAVLSRVYPGGAQEEIETRQKQMEVEDSALLARMTEEVVEQARAMGI